MRGFNKLNVKRSGQRFGFGHKNGNNVIKLQVQVRHSTSPYPHRPGYGIGSMLPPGLIKGMEHEAAIRSKIAVYDQLLNDLEATERELLLEQNSLANNLSDKQTLAVSQSSMQQSITKVARHRNTVMNKKIASTMELAEYQTKQIEKAYRESKDSNASTGYDDMTEGAYSTFSSNIESPLNWDESQIVSVTRGSESISISSQFFDVNTSKQMGTSHARNVATSVQESRKHTSRSGFYNQKKKTTWTGSTIASSVHESVTNTMQQHAVESTLVLNAMATHRWVRQLQPLKVDAQKLLAAWNYYQPHDKIDLARLISPALFRAELLKAQKNSGYGSRARTISMVSEEFLGSSMVGLVHFIKKSETESNTSSDASSAQETRYSKERNTVTWSRKVTGSTGSTSHVSQAAKKAMDSISQTGINVVFNVVVQGYMPTMKSSIVKDSIKEFSHFTPRSVDVSSDESLMQGTENAISKAENIRYTQLLGSTQSNAGAMIKATIEGLTDAQENSYRVLDYNTFMTTFDDYVRKAPKDKFAGIPIGMNIKQWTKADVLMYYYEFFREKIESDFKKQKAEREAREEENRQRAKQLREEDEKEGRI